MARFLTLGSTHEVPPGEGRAFEVGTRVVAVFNDEGVFRAIDDCCPHSGASLATGHFEAGEVSCPWHAWRFNVTDGAWCDNRRLKIDVFEIRVENEEIQVGVDDEGQPRMIESNSDSRPESTDCRRKCEDLKSSTKSNTRESTSVSFKEFQALIREMYHEKDVARGIEGTFMWLLEEVGELSSALRQRDGSEEKQQELAMEFADVLAWLTTIANVAKVDLSKAISEKYGSGCPGCGQFVCLCSDSEKP